jgi:hypothetical protein
MQPGTGNLSIVKDAMPNHAQDFSFTTSSAGLPPSFTLDDDPLSPVPNVETFYNLAPGTYGITEVIPAGWAFNSVSCIPPSAVVVIGPGPSVSVTLAAGDNVQCTFTNTQLPPTPDASCRGDCDSGGAVTIGELITAVNISLGRADIATCAAIDGDGDGAASIAELVRAVLSALNGCPAT